MKKPNYTLLSKIAEDLVNREVNPGEIHVCPICTGTLHVLITVYTEVDLVKKSEIAMHCDNCKIKVFYQDDAIPTWAKETESTILSLKDALDQLKKDSDGS